MNKYRLAEMLRHWKLGSLITLIIVLIGWFTGWRKWRFEEARTFSELLEFVASKPHVFVGVILFGGIIISFAFYAMFEKDKTLED